jgi:hypothetical protein
MKKIVLGLLGATFLAGAIPVITADPASARQVCRRVVTNRVVWRNGRRHLTPVSRVNCHRVY